MPVDRVDGPGEPRVGGLLAGKHHQGRTVDRFLSKTLLAAAPGGLGGRAELTLAVVVFTLAASRKSSRRCTSPVSRFLCAAPPAAGDGAAPVDLLVPLVHAEHRGAPLVELDVLRRSRGRVAPDAAFATGAPALASGADEPNADVMTGAGGQQRQDSQPPRSRTRAPRLSLLRDVCMFTLLRASTVSGSPEAPVSRPRPAATGWPTGQSNDAASSVTCPRRPQFLSTSRTRDPRKTRRRMGLDRTICGPLASADRTSGSWREASSRMTGAPLPDDVLHDPLRRPLSTGSTACAAGRATRHRL